MKKHSDSSDGKASNAIAFVSVNGKTHQVLIAGSNLLSLLEGWFRAEGRKGIPVDENPVEGITLGEPELLPTSPATAE